ncbi:MAG: hypothetical protein ACREXI_15145, partial [Caldimonas sp.]
TSTSTSTSAGAGASPASGELVVELAGASGYRGTLTLAPGHPGRNVLTVQLKDLEGRSFDPAEATLRLRNAHAGIEAIDRLLHRTAPGVYCYEGSELAFAGDWNVTVQARVGDFDEIELRADVMLR